MASLEEIVALAKRRGFVYPSSEIYGGLANVLDFGPLGTLLKNNLRDLWWKNFVLQRENIVGVDTASVLPPVVWEASGHVSGFNEALVDCKECKSRFRADHLIENALPETKVEGLPHKKLEEILKTEKIKCPNCKKSNWTDIRKFNQLVEVKLGVLEEGKNSAYLRGEIAQGLFLNYKNVLNSTRIRVPFGIAQQGKAYRNEVTMGQFTHRTFEFDLMEFEYFVHPTKGEETFDMWRKEMWDWALSLGIGKDSLRWREHEEFERSHYSKRTMDIEYKYPFGFKEMFGIAYRTDFDLKNHMEKSGVDLTYTDPATNEKYIPHVVEPTFGLSRLTGIMLFEAYQQRDGRTVLSFAPSIAPYKAAVFPLLSNKSDLVVKARTIFDHLKLKFNCDFDDRGNIGKRYAAQDEAGTPMCITVDFDTLKDDTVTIRDRDTTKQVRVSVDKLEEFLNNELGK